MLQGKNLQAQKKIEYRLEVLAEYKKSLDLMDCGNIATNYALLGNTEKCKEYIHKADKLLEDEIFPAHRIAYSFIIAEVYRILQKFELGKAICLQSINMMLELDDAEELVGLAIARFMLGNILVGMREYQEAVTYLEKAKTAFEICGYFALGDTFLALGKAHCGLGGAVLLHDAKQYVEQALAEFQRLELHHKTQEANDFLQKLK
jgi:tetratricopeptide (TPR) repeat protein